MVTPNVNDKARQILEKVRAEYGYTFEQIAEICGVATGSIQRWYSTGKAKSDKIAPLVKLVTNNRLEPEVIANNIIEIYWHIKRPYYLLHTELRDMSGRERLSPSVIAEIEECLFEKGFSMINDQNEDDREIYIILRKKWLRNKTKPADSKTLKEFYFKKIEEEFDEFEEW